MIFVSVGTIPFPFIRMNTLVEAFIQQREDKELIIYQCGSTPCIIQAKNVHLFSSIPFGQVQKYIKESRIVVCHGGPATIFQVLQAGKIPYVFPRVKRFGEHVNDHQKHFANFLEKKRMMYRITFPLKLKKMEPHNIKPKYSSDVDRLICHLEALRTNS